MCSTISLCTFLADCDLAEIIQVMLALECVFNASLRTAENAVLPPDVIRLYSAALSAWSLLLTLLPPRHIHDISRMYVECYP